MDAWHGILISACTSLAAAVAVLWRAYANACEQRDDAREAHIQSIERVAMRAPALAQLLTESANTSTRSCEVESLEDD